MTWTYSAGDYGTTVTVYEREPGGPIYVRIRDGGRYKRFSLGHRNKQTAQSYADRQSAAIRDGLASIYSSSADLGTICDLYRALQIPRMTSKKAQRRRLDMWLTVLGSKKDPRRISSTDWESFERRRKSGAIDSSGQSAAEKRPVSASTVAMDMSFLKQVLNWAARFTVDQTGEKLLVVNPIQTYKLPRPNRRPRQQYMTRERFDQMMEAARRHTFLRYRDGRQVTEPSFMPVLLILAMDTGRRISSILSLKWADISWEKADFEPFGAITWVASANKTRLETRSPMTPAVREALQALRDRASAIGGVHCFPAMKSAGRAKDTVALRWFREVEVLAGLTPLEHGGWHMLRRTWATERKHIPVKDIMAAGDWQSHRSVLRYIQTTPESAAEATFDARPLRERDTESYTLLR